MAKIRFYENVFEKDYKEEDFNTNDDLHKTIEDFSFQNVYKDLLVECYDCESDETFYAPLLDDDITDALVLVNGREYIEGMVLEDSDLIQVYYLPLSNESQRAQWTGGIIGNVLGSIVGAIGGLVLTGNPVGLIVGAALGGTFGAALGWYEGYSINKLSDVNDKYKINIYGKEGTTSPDVRGAENQILTGNNFPYVIGRHLVTPFLIGSPYTEYVNTMGKDAVIRLLLCVGYAPLKLTDFKFGENLVAYNRSANGITRDTITNGLLKGCSDGKDMLPNSGDILDYFKNNDIELEIIQQHPDKQVDYGTIYPDKIVDQEVNANILFVADGNLTGLVTYKGRTFSNGFRTNTVKFSESCPMEISVTIDIPNGLYGVRTDSFAGTQVHQEHIPMTLAIQWRSYDIGNNSSDANGADWNEETLTIEEKEINQWHDDWTEMSDGVSRIIYNADRFQYELDCHHGSVYDMSAFTGMEKNLLPFSLENVGKLFVDGKLTADNYKNMFKLKGNGPEIELIYYKNFANIPLKSPGWKAIQVQCGDNWLTGAMVKSIDVSKLGDYAAWTQYNHCYAITLSLTTVSKMIVNDGVYALTTGTFNSYSQSTPSGLGWSFPMKKVKAKYIYWDDKKYEYYTSKEFDVYCTTIFADFNIFDCKIKTTNNVIQSWANKRLTAIGYDTSKGEDILSQKRITLKKTFTKEECKKIISPSNPTKCVEVRVLRITPNYKNQTANAASEYGIGEYSYSDNIVWTSLVTKCFNEDILEKEDRLEAVKPLNEKDLRKLCLVAVKAKADSTGVIEEQLRRINCIAESFSPYFDTVNHKWFPENIERKFAYFKPDGTGKWTSISESEYLSGRQEGLDYVKEKVGTNYADKMLRIALADNGKHNDRPCSILNEEAMKYNVQNAASGFVLSCVGSQNGRVALGYNELNMLSLADWYEFNEDVTDGSYYDKDTIRDGVSYLKGMPRHFKLKANAYIYKGQKLEDLLKKLTVCGRACYVLDESSRIKIVIDKPVDYPKGVINQQTCISGTNTYLWGESPAGLQFNFSDENDGYLNNTVYCWNDNNSREDYKGNVEAYSIDYVTDPYQIWTLGRYILASKKLQRECLTRKVGLEGKTYSLGDVLLVQDDTLLLGGGSARVQETIINNGKIYGFVTDASIRYTGEKDSEGNIKQGVTIYQPKQFGKSRAVTFRLAEPKKLRFELSDGTIVTYSMDIGETNTFIFENPIELYTGDDPSATLTYEKYQFKTGDIVLFGEYGKISQEFRITKVKPEKDGSVTETLAPYYKEMYNYGTVLPSFQSVMTIPSAVNELYDLSEVPDTVADLVDSNASTLNQATQIIQQTIDSNKITMDVSPEFQTVPLENGQIKTTEVYIECFTYYLDKELQILKDGDTEDGVIYKANLKEGGVLTHWNENRLTVSTSYLTGDQFEVEITATVKLAGEIYTRKSIATVARLYGGESSIIHKMQFPYGEKIKLSPDGQTRDPENIKALKKVIISDKELDTDYGTITVENYPEGTEAEFKLYTQLTTEQYSQIDYYKKFSPMFLKIDDDTVLAVEKDVGAVLYSKG